jgi:hypothetical protein
MLDLGTFAPIDGAWSRLLRNDSGISLTINTYGLEPGETFTVWWVVFNYPEFCNGGCGEDDVLLFGGPAEVQGTVLYATGHVVGGSGQGKFGAHLSVGDASDALLGIGPGLVNPRGAEVHVVVRSHGPLQPGLVDDQISTFGGGCNNAPPGTGAPGNFACYDPQGTIHLP